MAVNNSLEYLTSKIIYLNLNTKLYYNKIDVPGQMSLLFMLIYYIGNLKLIITKIIIINNNLMSFFGE